MSPRFLVAPDSFKGTYAAAAVADAISNGLEVGGGEAERCPVADGGEGTMEVLLGALGGERRRAAVHDPLRRPMEASFGLLGDGATAIVETAQASGLPLVAQAERDPERADTFGTGELIAAAAAAGARRVLLAVGGSASTDGGAGAIEALRGARAAGDAGDRGALRRHRDLRGGGAAVRAAEGRRQGGGRAAGGSARRAGRRAATGPARPADERLRRGAIGRALGLRGAAPPRRRLRPRRDRVRPAARPGRRRVSGEGRFDSQSLAGKVVGEVAARCAAAGRPLHLVVGAEALEGEWPAAVASVTEAGTLEAMRGAGRALATRGRVT